MNHSVTLRRTVGALLASSALLALAISPAATAAAAPPKADQSIPSGADQASLHPGPQSKAKPSAMKGEQAIKHLGRNLETIAGKSNMSLDQVKKVLSADHTVEVSQSGTLQVADALGGTGATISTGSSSTPIWPVGDTLYLHSRINSPLKIFLDFNGHTTTGTAWNTDVGKASIVTPVWGRDNVPSTFNTAEAAAIQHAYASVAEDFAPFNVDVTTQDPGVEGLRKTSATDAYYGIRVVVGPNTWLGVDNSGFAKFYSFSWNTDTPAFCFADALTPTKQIAECISHETGHTVGLFHDGAGTATTYYAGHANWAPIMGDSYRKAVTQWSRGEYPGANNGQDDLAIIASYLGWVADDYVGTTATTATLPAGTTRSGQISWGVGELDAFKFSLTTTRTMNIQSWEWFQAVDPNLNMRVRVTNASGTVLITSSPAGNTRTNMNVTLNAGTYYVFVDGVGEGTTSTGYTNYGSLGMYNILLQFI